MTEAADLAMQMIRNGEDHRGAIVEAARTFDVSASDVGRELQERKADYRERKYRTREASRPTPPKESTDPRFRWWFDSLIAWLP